MYLHLPLLIIFAFSFNSCNTIWACSVQLWTIGIVPNCLPLFLNAHKRQTCSSHLQAAVHSTVLARGNVEVKLQTPLSVFFFAEYYSTSKLLQTFPSIRLPFTFQVYSLRGGDSKGGGWGGNINVYFPWNSAGTNHPEHRSKEQNRAEGLHFWLISAWCCRLCVLAGESFWSNQENRDACKFAYSKISSCLNKEKAVFVFALKKQHIALCSQATLWVRFSLGNTHANWSRGTSKIG